MSDAEKFDKLINQKQSNLKFTIVYKNERQLPFPDKLIDNTEKMPSTTIYAHWCKTQKIGV